MKRGFDFEYGNGTGVADTESAFNAPSRAAAPGPQGIPHHRIVVQDGEEASRWEVAIQHLPAAGAQRKRRAAGGGKQGRPAGAAARDRRKNSNGK
jgi:hypothetical protein